MTDAKTTDKGIVVEIKASKMDLIYDWLDNVTFRAEEWDPDYYELKSVMDSFDEDVRTFAITADKTKRYGYKRDFLKKLLFLLWLSETAENMTTSTYNKLNAWLRTRMIVVDD